MKINLVNALKYFSVILVSFANIFRSKLRNDLAFTIFIILSVVSALFSYGWDLYMDWGLLRRPWNDKNGKRLLRPKIIYPSWFYYYAMVSNLIFRFAWLLVYIKGLP